jgi:hypothetical protein
LLSTTVSLSSLATASPADMPLHLWPVCRFFTDSDRCFAAKVGCVVARGYGSCRKHMGWSWRCCQPWVYVAFIHF